VVDAAERLPRTPDNIRFILQRQIDVVLRHRDATMVLVRDVAAVVTALAPKVADARQLSERTHTWLAGPDPAQLTAEEPGTARDHEVAAAS
jgi:hypothetical protein